MTAQMIRRFMYCGEFFEGRLVQTKEDCRITMENEMREYGFVPLLDINPVWQTRYVSDDRFWFQYTWQGVYIGKEAAWEIAGVTDGKLIPYSQKSK